MKKNKPTLLLILVALVFIGCPGIEPESPYLVIFINNSLDTVFYLGPAVEASLPEKSGITKLNKDALTIKPRTKIKYDFQYDRSDTIQIYYFFLFHRQVIDTVQWDTIRKYDMVLKRYAYTFNQLDSLNWTITYP